MLQQTDDNKLAKNNCKSFNINYLHYYQHTTQNDKTVCTNHVLFAHTLRSANGAAIFCKPTNLGVGMAKAETGASANPPYVGWALFKRFLEHLKRTSVPPRIDPTVMKGMSGGTQSQLRGALRFLRLTDANGTSNPQLRHLVGALGTDDWPKVISDVVFESYADLVGGVDLDDGTLGQLRDAFRARGDLSGDSLDKALRFWLSAVREAGAKVSPHFGPSASGDAGSTVERPRRVRRNRRQPGDDLADEPRPLGVQEIRFPLPGKDVRMWFPEDLTEAELNFVWKYLNDYLALLKGADVQR